MLPFLLRRDFIISPDFTPGFVSLGSIFLVSADLKLSRNILSGKGQMGRQGRDPGTPPSPLPLGNKVLDLSPLPQGTGE